MLRRRFAALLAVLALLPAAAEQNPLSPREHTQATVGPVHITIDYSSPAMRGRKIYGGLVPYGQVWRTGADTSTTLTLSGTVMLGNLKVPAGVYSLYTLPSDQGDWKLIVNRQHGQWGTVYNQDQDLGRVHLMERGTPAPVEHLKIEVQVNRGVGELHILWDDKDLFTPIVPE